MDHRAQFIGGFYNQGAFYNPINNYQQDVYGNPINNYQQDAYGNPINLYQQGAYGNAIVLAFHADEKEKAMILKLIKLLLAHGGDLNKTNVANESVLSLSYAMPNERYFKMWIFHLKKIDLIANASGKSLLRKMINDKRHNVLSLTLQKCKINDDDVQYLLTLAVKALKQKDMKTYQIIVEACDNRNILIKEGETFLTYLLKTDEDEATFKSIVESRYFDLNIVNKLGETALIIACQKLKPDIVKILLELGSDVTYKNYYAVETTLAAKLKNPSPDNEAIANQIMQLLMNKPANRQLVKIQKLPIVPLSERDIFTFDKNTDILPILHLLWKHLCDLVKLLENNENILSLTYNLIDKKYFECLLENVQEPLRLFSNEAGMKLLMKMSSEQNWNYLSKLLDLSVIENTSNSNLLKLALEVLKKPELKIYEKIIDKCTDVNVLMTGGETFLTNLFKHNIEEEIIKIVIKSKVFDVKRPNEKDETTLMLACSRLMESIVEFLLSEGCEISHKNYGAISMTVLANKTIVIEEAEKKKTGIFNLFFRHNKLTDCHVKRKTKSKISTTVQNSIPGKTLIGNNTGIECSSNTNFLESIIISLFAKSDNLDFMFHPIIEEKHCGEERKRFRDVMANNIVYALRQFGYVGSDGLDELAKTYKKINIYEIDDFSMFFCNMWPMESLLSLVSYDNIQSHCMSLKLFVELENCLDYITSQELLNISMIQNKLMFTKVSACLIVEAVRDLKSVTSYKYIIPSKRIEISNVNFKSFKKCHQCEMAATRQCPQCIITNGIEVNKGLFCNSHKCHHTGLLELPQYMGKSRSNVSLKLCSIICKCNGRYLSYVNQKGIAKDWFLYETVTEENCSVPKSSFDQTISEFLNMDEKEIKNSIMKIPFDQLENVLKNSCIFIYENDAITCY